MCIFCLRVPKVIYCLRYSFLLSKNCMHNEIWVYTEILPLTVPYTLARIFSTLWCLLPLILERIFGTQCRKSIESWNNRRILEYIWIASIVPIMREWFSFNRLQLFTIVPIVRIELEAIQAIVIVPIVRVLCRLRSVSI